MTLEKLINQLVGLIDIAVPVLVGVALLLFLVSVVRYIYKAGDASNKGDERKAMLWGLVALFVLVSIWGILRIFEDILPLYEEGRDFRDVGDPLDIRPVR